MKQFPAKISLIKLKLSIYSFLLLTILIGKLDEGFLIDGKKRITDRRRLQKRA